ncbi:MAG: endonuclease [Thermoanaerobaculia bacterium]|jgi:endonuclease-8|nr:endonuclease [Thermoanaerobaculia bacterium]
MPEGDSIYRAAQGLHRALAGKVVTSFETVLSRLARVDDQTPLRGRTIERVISRGKNLIIEFSGDLHLHTHMKMSGSWHIYRPGERWQRPHRDMRIVLGTAEFVAVAFNVPVAEFHTTRTLARDEDLRRLGPDLLGAAFDAAEAMRRIRAHAGKEIANVLLNQRVIAGIGNIWKSETLFDARIDPFTIVSALDDEQIDRIVASALKLLRRSASGRSEFAVYSRGGDPCRKCRTPLRSRKQGEDARWTYWCPKCQG